MSSPMRTPFAMVPAWVITRVTDATALRVYIHLAWKYANAKRHAFPTEAVLAGELGYSERTIGRSIKTLRDGDALVVTRSQRADGYYGRNLYWLPMDDPRDPVAEPSRDPVETLSEDSQNPPSVPPPEPEPRPAETAIVAGRLDQTQMTGQDQTPVSDREPDLKEQPDQELKQSAAAASPSTPPLTDQDQNIDRWRDHAAQTRSADPPPHDDPEDVWNLPPNRYVPTLETLAIIGQGEKWQRLYDLIEATAGELDHNEAHAVEAMLDRGDHWQKVTRWVCNNRGYDTTTATALIARITRRDVA